MRNVEFEVCYYAEANGYLAKCHCKCVTEVVTHKGSMTFEDFIILKDSIKDSLKKSLEPERYETVPSNGSPSITISAEL